MMSTPNILLIIWDACRADAIKNAPTFQQLANQNLSFTNVFSPSTWSHPAHASLFTGKLPSSHGICTSNDVYESVPLTEELQEQNYRTVCVTSNSYASRSFGLDQGFDEYVFTFTLDNPDGLIVSEAVSEYLRKNPSASNIEKLIHLADRCFHHGNSAVSFKNLFGSILRKLVTKKPLPKMLRTNLKTNATYEYRPEWNTIPIKERISQHNEQSDSNRPLFLFSNYMTPHHPYLPEVEHQQEVGNAEIHSLESLSECNREFGHPLAFIEKSQHNDELEEPIGILRDGYRGEIHAVDSELNEIITYLEEQNMREDTVIIVTSDHGELLGEYDLLNNRRIGHLDSVSDHLFTVPLLIAHPSLSDETIRQPALFQNLMKMITELGKGKSVSSKLITQTMVSSDPVIIECPPRIQSERISEFDIPKDVKKRLRDSIAIVRHEDWTVLYESSGELKTWLNRERRGSEDAPEELITIAKHHCEEIKRTIDNHPNQHHELSGEVEDRLKELGYK